MRREGRRNIPLRVPEKAAQQERSQYGNVNPAGIIAPAIAATFISTLTAVVYCKLKEGKEAQKQRRNYYSVFTIESKYLMNKEVFNMNPKKWKRTKGVISLMTAFTMLSSSIGTTVAAASVHTDSQTVMAEDSEASVLDSQQPVIPEDSTLNTQDSLLPAAEDSEPAGSDDQQSTVPGESESVNPPADSSESGETVSGGDTAEPDQPQNNVSAPEKAAVPTAQEAYEKMIALKEDPKYYEGTPWTNSIPYTLSNAYTWHGGKIQNMDSGVGCAAFAFILSDAAFGDLPAIEIPVKYENVNVGDILRINGNSHSVIVLRKNDAGVTIAEGNYNKTVHWGRTLSKEEVERADYLFTRYPAGQSPSDTPENDTVAESGKEGTLDWTLTQGGTLTISGTGAIGNYDLNQLPPWNTHNDKINTIIIENGITSIGEYAFYQSNAASVYISDKATNIGQYAFYGSNIISVTIPSTVETIGNSAFRNCKSLVSASVSEGVKIIVDNAFRGCTTLKYIDFPSSITSIGAGAFMDCIEMARVRFMPGSGAVDIGDNVFTRCRVLTDVTLPEKVKYISFGMFTDCLLLAKLHIPAGIEEIKFLEGAAPFQGCPKNIEINFAGSRSRWNELQGDTALKVRSGCENATVNCDVPFPNPFTEDSDNPDNTTPSVHEHSWSATDWNQNSSYHWHECTAKDCPITTNSEKDGYEAHSYSGWVIDVGATYDTSGIKHRDCSVCSYRQTSSVPATGNTDPWGWGNYQPVQPVKPTPPPSIPVTPVKPEPSVPSDATDTDHNSESNTTDDSSNEPNDSDKPDSSGSETDNSGSSLKQIKTEFKQQLKTGLKEQLKPQLKTMLKKQFQSETKLKAKAKLKKQLKSEIKPKLRAKFKKQLKKEFGEELGKEFLDYFNKQFDKQFDKLYTEYFNTQYKQLSAKQKKK